MPAAVETKVHEFYSRGRNEKLIRQPLTMLETALGRQIKQQDRVAYDFAPEGRLTLREGEGMLQDGPPDPETGERTWQDAVSWLTRGFQDVNGHFGPHPLLHVRFWHEGHEPDRPLPTEADFAALVTDAAAALEAEPIVVALAQEVETHNRPLLVAMAERAIDTIAATRAAMQEAADAAETAPDG